MCLKEAVVREKAEGPAATDEPADTDSEIDTLYVQYQQELAKQMKEAEEDAD